MRLRWALACAALCAYVVASPCQDLHEAYSRDKQGLRRSAAAVSVYGRARAVCVLYDAHAPGRAAAALLAAVARHGLRYSRLRLLRSDRDSCGLFQQAQDDCHLIDESDEFYDNITLAPSAVWRSQPCEAQWWCARAPVVGLRLRLLAAGAAPSAARLHAAAAPTCPSQPNPRLLLNRNETSAQTIWYSTQMPDWNDTIVDIKKRLSAVSPNVTFIALNSDSELRGKVQRVIDGRSSQCFMVFVDYDIWSDVPAVVAVAAPGDADPPQTARVGDARVLEQMAPPLLDAFLRFSPTPTHLREVLELAAARPDSDIEEAACSWAIDNAAVFATWFDQEPVRQYWVDVYLCEDDRFRSDYERIAETVTASYESKLKLKIAVRYEIVDCRSEFRLNDRFIEAAVSSRWPNLIGAVATGEGVAATAPYAAAVETALLLYGAPPAAVGAPAAAGSLTRLAAATADFVADNGWRRLAVLSERTPSATEFANDLKRDPRLAVKNAYYDGENEIGEILREFRHSNARVFYLNTRPNVTKTVLCEVNKLGMDDGGCVWIFREWYPYDLTCRNRSFRINTTNLFSVSYWWRDDDYPDTGHLNDSGHYGTLRRNFKALWKDRLSPPWAVPLADALISLLEAFDIFRTGNKDRLYDLHGDGSARLLLKNLEEKNFTGIVQKLHYRNGHIANPIVYVDRWNGSDREGKALWRIENDTVKVVYRRSDIFDGATPGDGSRLCLTTSSGDNFDPACNDIAWFTTLACTILLAGGAYLGRLRRLRRLRRQDSILRAQLLAQHTSSVLGQHFVDRASLEPSGPWAGRGRLAVLRAPGRPPLVVAVAAPASDADELELHREAVTLASLKHENVVRLVGACTIGAPLLVLTAHAFFGDLRRYLRERRHLALDDREPSAAGEAAHVSPAALTRLGREAAAALEYLSRRGVVHRDVRAANCLVDGDRTLKLANFRLARETAAGAHEYSWGRRDLQPVPWAAPESLERGEFTAASDAWSLGVLLLELLTLGAPPYGAWPPERVLRYVCAGGRPPLPADVSRQTRVLLGECWRRAADERPTAGAVRGALSSSVLVAAREPARPPRDEEHPLPADLDREPLLPES